MKTSISLGSYTVKIMKMLPHNDAKMCRVIALRTGHVDIVIDSERLAEHAKKALLNKSGKSVLASGAIQFVAAKHTFRELPAK